MGEGGAGFIERVSVPYLIKFNDELNACKEGLTQLRKKWKEMFPDERREKWAEIQQHYHNALITAKAVALNSRVRLDDRLEAARVFAPTKHQR